MKKRKKPRSVSVRTCRNTAPAVAVSAALASARVTATARVADKARAAAMARVVAMAPAADKVPAVTTRLRNLRRLNKIDF